MKRSEPDTVQRLQTAAFELFAAQGFERTTISQITERAGVTERSFLDHFADTGDVLFGPLTEAQREIMCREIAAAPLAESPLGAVVIAMQATGEQLFQARRPALRLRRDVIESNAELGERALSIRAMLSQAIVDSLRARDLIVEERVLVARLGMLIQDTALQRWIDSTDDRPLSEFLTEVLRSVRTSVVVHQAEARASGGRPRRA